MAWWQILLLSLFAGIQILDELQTYTSLNTPIGAGLVTGIIMGDMKTGLLVGAGMQLTVLGIGTFGGASKIDATSGTILGTAFSISSKGLSPQQAISTIGVPVAAVLIELDVLARFLNTFFAHRIDHFIEVQNYGAIERNFLYGALPWALSRAIPVFMALAFGRGLVQQLANALNGQWLWLGTGLTVAGAALPAVGFAILLRYLPVKKHFAYLVLGFTLTVLFSGLFQGLQTVGTGLATVDKTFTGSFNSLPMLAIAFIGFGFATLHYKSITAAQGAGAARVEKAASSASDKGEITDDEL